MRLIIGYGNTLRSDDAVGQKIATVVADWQLPEVRSLIVHQLTPELAIDIAEAELVIFVDVAINKTAVEIKKITPTVTTSDTLGHSSNPYTLLSYSKILYNYVPDAYWILVPGVNFEFGEELSPLTQQGMIEALAAIKKLLIFL
jgi:hydrogenase maturation protease